MRLELPCVGSWLVVTLAAAAMAMAADPPRPDQPFSSEWIAAIQREVAASEYQVSWQERIVLPDLTAAWHAANRAQGLRFYFTAEGLRVVDRTAAGNPELLRLTLAGVGRGGFLGEVERADVAFAAEAERLELRRPGLVERFVNEPGGLRHRVELAQRPDGDGRLEVALGWQAAGMALSAGRAEFTAESGRRLGYAVGARDAVGKELAVELVGGAGSTLVVTVDDQDAVYPIGLENLLTATADTVLEGNQTALHLGDRAVAAGDFNGDGYADVAAYSPWWTSSLGGTGAVLVFNGGPGGIPSNGSGPIASAADAIIESDLDPTQEWPAELTCVGDVNGDGYDDLAAGLSTWDPVVPPANRYRGGVWVFHGSAAGVTVTAASAADGYVVSGVDNSAFGWSVRGAGDVNGDGYGDLIAGAYTWSDAPSEVQEGAAFLFLGSAAGITASSINGADTKLEGNQGSVSAGHSVAGVGDLDADGFDDIIVGIPGFDGGENDEGAVAILYGGAAGIASNPTQPLAERADTLLQSNLPNSYMEGPAAAATDVNGDGAADLILGWAGWSDIPSVSWEGALLVLHGGPGGIASNGSTPIVGVADTVIEANPAPPGYDLFLGHRVTSAGDLNGDGFGDLVVTAPTFSHPETSEGGAFVFLGREGGIPSSRVLPVEEVADVVIEGNTALLYLGFNHPDAGDVDGDGFSDLVLGVSLVSNPEAYEGAVFIYHGAGWGLAADTRWATPGAQQDAWHGARVAVAGDVNRDGYSDVAVAAPAFDAGAGDEGRVLVYHGGPGGLPLVADWSADGGQAGELFGSSLESAGDVNGDGFGDLVVGSPRYGNGQTDEGRVSVFLGSASGLGASAAWTWESGSAGAKLGSSVAGAADVNGDGFGDVAAGAEGYSGGQSQEGRVFLFYGSGFGIYGGPGWSWESDHAGDGVGAAVAGAGDVDGDGFGEVVVGGPTYTNGQAGEGRAWVFRGSAGGLSEVPYWQVEIDRAGAAFGTSVAGVGDVDGDGFDDVAIGAAGESGPEVGEGRAYVYHGSGLGLSTVADAVLEMDRAGAGLGSAVGGAGDVNGDGYADVAVGAPADSNPEAGEGRAYLFLGSSGGVAPAPAWTGEGGQAGAALGSWMAGGGDVDGDGFADLVVGAPGYDDTLADEGAAYLYSGGGWTGRPVVAGQLRGGGDPIPVQPWGLTVSGDDFQVRVRATSPRGPELVKLHAEACPAGVAFGSVACEHAVSSSWTELPATPEGVDLVETVTGLSAGTLYHWRAHVLYAPLHAGEPGITPPPNPRHGPWRRLYGGAASGDLRVGEPQQQTVGFVLASSVVPEGGGPAVAWVVVHTSDGAATRLPASVGFMTFQGAAVDGEDYVGAAGRIEIPIGTPDGELFSVAVELIDDPLDEPDEDFVIELGEPMGVVVGQAVHQVWIDDDDPEPGLAGVDVVVGEGGGAAQVELLLSGPSGFEIEVHYATQDGTAVAGDDYLPVSGVAVIPPLAPGVELLIPILDDGDDEPDETLAVALWDPLHAVLLTPVVTVTIVDNDEPGLPFADGFETGDTSAWSATVP